MEELKETVERLLGERYPGARVFWEEDGARSRPGGTIIWPGFAEMPQIDRQREIGEFLRERLGPKKSGLGILFAFTEEERDAVADAA